MEFVIGSYDTFCGHTWISSGGGYYYALRSLADASSMLLYKASEVDRPGENLLIPREDLKAVGEYPTVGRHSCHITLLGTQAVVADYSSGTLSLYELDAEGVPTGEARVLEFPPRDPHSDPGIDLKRQEGPHIHSSWLSPDGKDLVVVDLGSDCLYRFSVEAGVLSSEYQTLELPVGCGPRHCAFNGAGNMLYVATELSDEVLVYCWPSMRLGQRCLVNECKPRGGGHIAISPDGRHLYASSRLENDGIAIYAISEDGLLTPCGYQPTGKHPRHFSISSDGKLLAVACRDSNLVQVMRRDSDTGLLRIEREFTCEKPVFIDFK